MVREFRRKSERLINQFLVEEKVSLISQRRKAKLSVTNSITGRYGSCHFKKMLQGVKRVYL